MIQIPTPSEVETTLPIPRVQSLGHPTLLPIFMELAIGPIAPESFEAWGWQNHPNFREKRLWGKLFKLGTGCIHICGGNVPIWRNFLHVFFGNGLFNHQLQDGP